MATAAKKELPTWVVALVLVVVLAVVGLWLFRATSEKGATATQEQQLRQMFKGDPAPGQKGPNQ